MIVESQREKGKRGELKGSGVLINVDLYTMSSHRQEKTLPSPIAPVPTPAHRSSLLHRWIFLLFASSISVVLLAFPPPSSLSPSLLLPSFFTRFSPSPSPPLLSEDGSLPAVKWEECGEGLSDKFSCARYEVPMDYSGKEEGVVSLSMIRYSGDKKKKRLGSLFVNP